MNYRVGIIGTENSHTYEFSKYINLPDENGKYRFPDFKVTMVYGDYPQESKMVAQKYNIETVCGSLDEMVGNVDAVVVCARDGKFHYKFAKPFLQAGIPVFLDKPTTIDADETVELIKLAKEKNVPLCGGSCLKFTEVVEDFAKKVKETEICGGIICAPLFFESEYSGFYFYAAHLAEICLAAFGWRPVSVSASCNNKCVSLTVNYDNFSVTGRYNDFCPDYYCGIFTKEGSEVSKIDLSNASEKEVYSFIDTVKNGNMLFSYEQLAAPVFFMNAVEEAYKTGKCVDINYKTI